MMERTETDPRAVRHTDEDKERAYQLWAFVASRRASVVSELLISGEYGEPVAVTDRTIRTWAQDLQWAQRVQDDLRAIAPDIRQQTITEIVFGALDGARYLRSVVDGRTTEPNKDRVTASVALLDKAGLSHTGTRADPITGITNPQVVAADAQLLIDGKSIAELMAIEAAARAKRST